MSGWERRRLAIARGIEKTALQLFAEHGVENVTVEQIAEAAGVSKRTIFRYFASREDILLAYPLRALAHTSVALLGRPLNESIIEAFKAALPHPEGPDDEKQVALLFGRVMLRSPEAG